MNRDHRIPRVSPVLNVKRVEGNRHAGASDARRKNHMLRVPPARCNISAAVSLLANEILTEIPGRADGAAGLDRLRRRLNSTKAAVWICDSEGARRVFASGDAKKAQPCVILELDHTAVAIQRLRRAGALLCRAGEVTGLEQLVPGGVDSFAVAATAFGDRQTAVLAVGWPVAVPPCVTAEAVPLQVAASLLACTLAESPQPVVSGGLPDAIMASLPDPIAVINREGIITAVNAAWSESAARQGNGALGGLGPGANYLDACRRASAIGPPASAGLFDGITAVSTGALDRFQTVYKDAVHGEGLLAVITAAPLRHPGGGAVIAHSEITNQAVGDAADRISESRFRRLTDGMPVPLFVIGLDGRVLHANQQWRDAADDRGGDGSGTASWTHAMDADTQARAASALAKAVQHRERLDIDLRLKGADGSYRWWTCTLAPRFGADGEVDSYVGTCHDVTGSRRKHSMLREVTRKLVVAQEEERARIARELHDDLGQQLALLASHLGVLKPTNLRRVLEYARGSLSEMADTLTTLSHQLHPGKLRLLGLAKSLQGLCREIARDHGVRIDLDTRDVPADLAEECGMTFYRIAQEALRNAVKHSGATTIAVELARKAAKLMLRISDDGKEFDLMTSPGSGLGLLTMRERVELAGGVLTVEPTQPRGTTIRVLLPIVRSAAAERPAPPAVAMPKPVPIPAPATRTHAGHGIR